MPVSHGLGLLEAIVCLTLVLLIAAVSVPATVELRSAAAVAAGARLVATELYAVRWDSARRGVAHGLLFGEDAEGRYWHRVRDGNGNGLRSAEVASGVDPIESGPHRLADRVAGVRFGFPTDGPFPRIPPSKGVLDDLTDPIRIGNTELFVFSPLGSSTSGTFYVTDGRRLYGIVGYGRTGRLRVWRYDPKEGQWTG